MSDLPPSGRPVPTGAPDEPTPWLVRPRTIRLFWIVSICVLAAVTLLDLVIEKHGHFSVEDGFAFGAWYGFLACVVLVVFSKALGTVLKRRDDWYDD